MGGAGLINSGGASGANDLARAVRTAVINKRAGGIGLISGRRAPSVVAGPAGNVQRSNAKYGNDPSRVVRRPTKRQ
jgi:DeoC/LacD family aldolase